MSAINIDISPTANYIQIPPFIPSDVSGLEIWLDASDADTLYLDSGKVTPVSSDGDTVGAWEDKSGNGNDVTIAITTNEPTYKVAIYNGRSTLRFDGIDNKLVSGAVAALNTDTISWFVMFKADSRTPASPGIVFRNNYSSGTNGTTMWGTFISTDSLIYSHSRDSSGVQKNGILHNTANLRLVSTVWGADNTIKARINGSANNQATAATASPTNHVKMTIGVNSSSDGFWFDGDICEIIIYTEELSDGDREAVEEYLAAKWGTNIIRRISEQSLYSQGAPDDWLGRLNSVAESSSLWAKTYLEDTDHTPTTSGNLHIRFSEDGGVTWTDEDTYTDDSAVSGFPIVESGGSQGISEGTLTIAPNDTWIILVPESDTTSPYPPRGTYQYSSTDSGATWSSDGQINTDSDLMLLNTKIIGSDIYAAGWYDPDTDGAPWKSVLYKSTNNGSTWSSVSDITSTSDATNECDIVHLGGNDILAVIRADDNATTYMRVSDDLGATWGTLTDITEQVGVVQRPKLYIFNNELGRVYLIGRSNITSDWRTTMWYSDDNGSTWSSPHHLHSTANVDSGSYAAILEKTGSIMYILDSQGSQTEEDIFEYVFERVFS